MAIFNMVGGGSLRINISNYSVLPLTGQNNQIALINSTAINDVYCQPTVPDDPVQGDIWMVTTTAGNAYLHFNDITIYIASIRQYDNGAWSYVYAWYIWQNSNWVTGRLTLIENGAFTGQGGVTFAGRLWEKDGTAIPGYVTLTEQSDCIQLQYNNTATTSSFGGYAGICSSAFTVGQYSNIHCEARFQWNSTGAYSNQRADLMVNHYNAGHPEIDALVFYNFLSNPTVAIWHSFVTDTPISSSTEEFCIFIGIIGRNNRVHYIQVFNLYLE